MLDPTGVRTKYMALVAKKNLAAASTVSKTAEVVRAVAGTGQAGATGGQAPSIRRGGTDTVAAKATPDVVVTTGVVLKPEGGAGDRMSSQNVKVAVVSNGAGRDRRGDRSGLGRRLTRA